MGADHHSHAPNEGVDNEDASSVATPVASFNNVSAGNAVISKTIRFYFAPTDLHRTDRMSPSEVHTEWIRIVQSAFGIASKLRSR